MQTWLKQTAKDLVLCLTFFTRLPLPKRWQGEKLFKTAQVGHAMVYFPLIGALLGGLSWILIDILRPDVPYNLVILIIMSFHMLATGAFHEDGLADTFDACGSQFNRDDTLRIMRDSRIGTYGSLALIMATLGKFILLQSLHPALLAPTILMAQVWSRWVNLPIMRWLPYCRGSASATKAFVEKTSQLPWWSLPLATAYSLALLLWLFGLDGLIFAVVAMVMAGFCGLYFRHKIQGVTGDCLGASVLLTELVLYFTMIML